MSTLNGDQTADLRHMLDRLMAHWQNGAISTPLLRLLMDRVWTEWYPRKDLLPVAARRRDEGEAGLR